MKRWALLALLALLTCPAVASAQCTVSSTGVNFGTYDVFAAPPRDSTGAVSYQCVAPLPVQITLSRGSSVTFTPRTLKKGAEPLNYNLYLDTGRSSIWGDGSGGTSYFTGTAPLLQAVNVTVYGRIPARQDVSAGSYTDTITVTINF